MRHTLLAFSLALLASAVSPLHAQTATADTGSTTQAVRGLIVQLRPADTSGREAPQAARARMLSVAQSAGVGLGSAGARAVGSAGHQLVQLDAPLQGTALDAAMRRLRLHPDVLSVEPDVRIKRLATPNDPGFSFQWHLQQPTAFASAINMPPAWDLSTGSSNVTVAVLDTGVRFSHPDLAGRLLPGYDMVSEVDYANDGDGRDADASDPGDWVSSADKRNLPGLFGTCDVENSSWHGTFIAGQIAAAGNNSVGIAGINWVSKVLPVRISGKCGALLSDILDGMRWAAGLTVAGVPANPNPARVLNLSFGGDTACSSSYQSVIDEITAAGALLVVAAGNEASTPKRPADCRNVVAVAAATETGLKTNYSNFGTAVALTAPGGTGSLGLYSLSNTGTTTPGTDSYAAEAGTSFSAPQATAVASLMLSRVPGLTVAQLIDRLKTGTRPHVFVASAPTCTTGVTVACNCTTATCGAGLLDAKLALDKAVAGTVPVASITPVQTATAGGTLTLDGSSSTPTNGATLGSYLWQQTAGSTVTIQNASAAVATVQLPATPGSFSFQLTVKDSTGQTATQTLSVTSVAPSSSGGGGGGGGATSLLWGAGLWLLALGVAWQRRRR